MSDASAEAVEAPQPLASVPSSSQPALAPQALEPPRRIEQAWRARLSWAQAALAVDFAMLVAAAVLTDYVSNEHPIPLVSTIVFSLLAIANLYSRGMYRAAFQLQLMEAIRAVIMACTVAVALVVTLHLVLSDSVLTAAQTAWLWLVAVVLLATGRTSLLLSERRARRSGEGGYRTLIVGAGNVGRLVATRLSAHPEIGLMPIGFLDKSPLYSGQELQGLPVLGASWDLDEVVREQQVERVIVTFSTAPTDVLLRVLKRCEQLGIRASFVPRLYETSTEQFTVESIGGIPLVTGHSPRPKSWQFAIKHAIDRVAAMFGLIVLSPIYAACSIAVYISLGRPILYGAERIGRDGAKFDMLKFRTMRGRPVTDPTRLDISSDTGTSGAEETDRLTRVGTFLRRFSLDELPQLLNVVRGDMSLVGPRPERTEYVEVLEQTVHRYDERHRVKSGITGWAQAHGLRGQTSLADRVEWDNYYIQNWSFWLDFKIVLLTMSIVFRSENAE